jgi:saccharopine dehydrogenase-like NADP-dependent oxidoreductase
MKRVVVFGYGPVGREITALFAARGDDVLVAQRSRNTFRLAPPSSVAT